MENNCKRCNAVLEKTTPFCPQCGASQTEASAALAAADPMAKVNWSLAMPIAIKNGLLMGVALIVIPVTLTALRLPANLIFLLLPIGLTLAAFIAVRSYSASSAGAVIRAGSGARIGAVTGFFSFLLLAIVTGVSTIANKEVQLQVIRKQLEAQSASTTITPEARQMMQQLGTPEGLVIIFFITMIFLFFFSLLMSTVGGVFGASTTKREEQQPAA